MKIINLLLLIALVSAQNFTLYLHSDPSARCLDGSPAGLYFHPGTLTDKFVIYFEGGGLCRGDGLEEMLQYCYRRSSTNLGSSTQYPKLKSFDSLSYLSSRDSNPFHEWNRVFVPYCDGSLHQGSHLDPIKYKDRSLYFRGSNNTLAHFDFLQKNYNLFLSTEIIITGTSAGGVASFIWSNYVYEHSAYPDGVLIVPDSGTFILDFPNYFNNQTMRHYTQETFKLVNSETEMPLTQCVKRYPSQQQCFQSGNLYPFIKPRVFILQSQYDAWGISQILNFKCIDSVVPSNMDRCNDTERAYIQKYRGKINEAVDNITYVERNGAWSVSCIQHGFLENMNCIESSKYRIPTTSGVQITNALLTFMKGGRRNYIDQVNWPNNIGCNGQSRAYHLTQQ